MGQPQGHRGNRAVQQQLALAILAFLESTTEWRGTAGELLVTLRKRYPQFAEPAEAFPRTPSALGAELRRITPLLRSQGITVGYQRQGKDRTRITVVSKA